MSSIHEFHRDCGKALKVILSNFNTAQHASSFFDHLTTVLSPVRDLQIFNMPYLSTSNCILNKLFLKHGNYEM